jgi:hypothetical protein
MVNSNNIIIKPNTLLNINNNTNKINKINDKKK